MKPMKFRSAHTSTSNFYFSFYSHNFCKIINRLYHVTWKIWPTLRRNIKGFKYILRIFKKDFSSFYSHNICKILNRLYYITWKIRPILRRNIEGFKNILRIFKKDFSIQILIEISKPLSRQLYVKYEQYKKSQ